MQKTKRKIKMKITGAIFDMDGTLADSLSFWDVFFKRVAKKYGLGDDFRPDPDTERSIRTLPFKEGMALMHERCGVGGSADEMLQTAFDMCRVFYAEDVEMKAGALDFLRLCKEKGIKMCVASATQRDLLEIVMERFGLYEYLPKVFSCGDIGKGKDVPDIFDMAREYLGTDKESTWIFEDSTVAIETAKKAGYKVVGIYDKYNFDHERVRASSDKYIAAGETLMKLKGKNI